jgi:hypothetical protein
MMAFLQPTKNKITLHFCFLQTIFCRFPSPKWIEKKALLKSCKDNLETYRNWKKKNKKDEKNSRIFSTYYFCSLGFQRWVHHFHLLLIILVLLKYLFCCLGLRQLLKQLERTIKTTNFFWGSSIFKSLKEK